MKQKKQHQLHTKPIMEELEPRQLFSGGLEGLIAENQLLDGGIHSDLNAGYSQPPASENNAQNIEAVAIERKELVFIDTDVENYQQLLNDILAQGDEDRNIEVILLDNERDGINQISETLANFDNLDAVHLISHGSDGIIDIGNTQLDVETLNQNLVEISTWGDAFTEDGDFLIYGCNLAQTEDGQSLIDALSNLTETDVAASDDLTGQIELGGDWDLEYQTGVIETDIGLSESVQQSWQSLLAVETVRDNFTSVSYSNNDGSQSWASGWQEIGDSDGVSSGRVLVESNALHIYGNSGSSPLDGVKRVADLSGATSATLNFDYNIIQGHGSKFFVEISTDNSSWTTLHQYNFIGSSSSSQSTDISAYISSTTYIRFVQTQSGNNADNIFFDNIELSYNVPNQAPTAANNTVTTLEDTDKVFTATEFGFADADVGDTLNSIKITSLESEGNLKLNGVDVTLNQVISKANIDSGLLTFSPAINGNGSSYDAFDFSVNDGTVDSASSYTMTIDVTAQNDTPTNITLIEATSVAINNPGFESQTFSENGQSTSITNWTNTGDSGVWNSTSLEYTSEAPEGNNVVYIDAVGTISQTLSENFTAGSSYLLSALVGDEKQAGDSSGWEMRLYAGTQLLGSVSNTDFNPNDDEFIKATLHLDADTLAVYSAEYGQALTIEFYDDGTAANVHFDDVQLEYTAISVAENAAYGTVVANVASTTDPDAGDTHTYTLTDNAGGRFAIDAAGQITIADTSLIDFETATSHDITVRVTDSGSLSYDEVITIQVSNVNEKPTDLITSGALYLDGSSDGITVPLLSLDNRSTFTVEMEINPARIDASGWSYSLVKQHNDTNGDGEAWNDNGFFLDVNDTKLGYHQYDKDDPVDIWQGGANDLGDKLKTNIWQTVTLTVDNGTAVIYLNGVQIASTTTLPPIVDSSGTLTFLDGFEGDVREIRVFDKALDSGEVTTSLTTNYDGTEANLLLLYDFEEGSGSTILDRNTPSYNGTLDNPAGTNWITIQSVQENSVAGTVVGFLSADDPDAGDILTYTIVGSSDFEIVGREIRVKVGANIDYETNTEHTITIQVTDSGGLTYNEDITIQVSDVANTLTVTTATDNNDSILVDGNVTHTIEWLNANQGADGKISLREAIIAANNTVGADTINFDISGAGPHTINVATALPTITDQITIDGSSEPDFATNGNKPIVILDGNDIAADGLVLGSTADGSTIKGLVIRDFGDDGIQIESGSDNNTIIGNYIGAITHTGDGAGTAEENTGLGIIVYGSGNTIGGTQDSDRNVISGNTKSGIALENSHNNTIQGNYIGTDAAGTSDINGITATNGQSGIEINGGSTGNLVGTNADGTDDTKERNVISGNNWYGIELIGSTTSNNTVAGNYIGTDNTGLVALGNTQGGVSFWSSANNNIVGGGATGAGNVISGNGEGILIAKGSSTNKVQGNYIGLGSDGSTEIGNTTGFGIYFERAGSTALVTGNIIGTDGDGNNDTTEGNVISANAQGIVMEDAEVTGNIIAGNYIGTDATGTLDKGNTDHGIYIINSGGHTIGGSGSNEGNLISGNDGSGIAIGGGGADNITIQGNIIGTQIDGASALGNSEHGLLFSNTAKDSIIGGINSNDANTIAYNSLNGVTVLSGSTGISTLGNSIHSNTGIGVDLSGSSVSPDGVSTNDSNDSDSGGNNRQNYPVLTTAVINGGQITINGTVTSTASTHLRIEFFANTTDDSSGYGEGERYLGFINITTDDNGDGSGDFTFSETITAAIASGEYITATATVSNAAFDSFSDTSEFAQNIIANIAPVLGNNSLTINEGQTVILGSNDLSATDTDNADSGLTFTVNNVQNGQFERISSAGIAILSFTQAEITSADIQFVHDGNENAPAYQVAVSDGILNTSLASASITFSNVNDAPVLDLDADDNSGSTGANYTTSYTEGAAAVNITDSDALLTDIDSTNLSSLTITLTNALDGINGLDEHLSFDTFGTGIGGVYTASTGILVLSNSDTIANYQKVLQTITYHTTSESPNTTDRIITFVANDGNRDSNIGTTNVTVNAVNDVPIATGNTVIATEDVSLVIDDSDFSFTDVENDSLTSVTITGLTLNGGTLTHSGGTVNVTNGMTITAAQLADLTFTSAPNDSSNSSFNYTVNDAGTGVTSAVMNITVNAVNDVPVNTVPGPQSINEDTSLAIGGISVNDVDGNLSTVQLSVSNGNVSVSLSGTASITAGNNDSNTLTLSGTQADINTALASLTYQGNLHFNGSDTLTVLSTDSNSATDSKTVTITVNAVNDEQSLDTNAGLTLNEAATATLTNTLLASSDIEQTATQIVYTVGTAPANGILKLSGSNLLATSTFTQDDIDNNRITYVHDGGETTVDSFDFNVDDGLGTVTSATFNITVTPINDSPSIAINTGAAVSEGGSVTLSATHLNEGDVDDSGAGLTYSVTTGPANGQLELTSSPGVAINSFTQDDIDNNRLIYVHNGSQTSTDNFDFTLADGLEDGAVAATGTFNLSISNVNDVPVNTVPGPQSINEDTSLAIGGISVNDVDGNLSTVQLSVSNGNVSVNLSGTASITAGNNNSNTLTLSGTQADINTALASLTYQGNTHFNGSDTLTVLSTDSDSATDSKTIAITVNAVNDEQSLDTNAGLTLNEAATATLTNTLLASSDIEQTATQIVYTVGTAPANGILKLSGSNLLATSTFTQDDIDNNRITYVHDGGETTVDSFDFNVDDGLGTVTSATFNITVTPINDSPSIAINTGAAVSEGGSVTLSATHLNEGDVDDSGAGLTYSVTTGPANGQLELTSSPGVAINSFTQDDIDNNRLIYVHNGSQTSTDNFDFTLADGLEDGAVAATGTFNLSISNVNDVPVNTVPGPQSINEDTSLAIGGISVNDVDGNLSTVQLSVSNGNVSVNLSGTASITAGNNDSNTLTLSGTQADINTALASLTYQGNTHFNGSDTLTVLSTDSDSATDSKTIAITVNAVNDEQSLDTNAGLTLNEAATATLTNTLLASSDIEQTATQIVYTVGTAPANGILKLSGSNLLATSTFTQDDIDNNRITYVHDGGETTVDSFDFNVDDGLGTVTSATFNITVTPINDSPSIAINTGAAVSEGGSVTLSATHLNEGDVDDSGAGLTYSVTTGPANGQLELTSSPGVAINSFTQDDIDNNRLIYVHNGSQTSTDNFDFTLADGLEDGAVAATGTFNLSISNVNDVPVNTVPGPQSINEDTSLAIGGISVNDVDGNLSTVQLSVSNGNVSVSLSGTASITAGNNDSNTLTLSGTQADINTALASLTYQGNTHFNGSDTLTVLSTDSNSATDSKTVTITVNAVNDEQSLDTNAGLTLNEAATATLTNTLLASSDIEQTATQIVYTVGTAPANGILKLSGSNLLATSTFTQDDIDNNRITYVHDGGETTVDSFDFNVDDGLGTVTSATFNITVTPINDSPSIAINTGAAVSEGGSVTLSATHLNEGDVDDSGAGLTYSVTTGPANGQLELTSSPGVAINSFTQDDIDNNRLIYVHNGSQTSTDNFDFTLADGLEDGAVAATGTFNLSISNVNDVPVNTVPGPQSINEDTSLAIGGISVNDVDGNLSTVQLSVSNGNVSVNLSGTASITAGNNNSNTLTLSGTQADINTALASLTYQGNLHFNGSDTLTVLSTDSNSATDSKTVTITVNAVNDEQSLDTNAGLTLNEAATATLTNTLLASSDIEQTATQIVYTVGTAPANGILKLSGSNLLATSTFTQDDIDNNRITYVHDGGETTVDSFDFNVDDGLGTVTSATFNITVTPINDSPSIAINTGAAVSEGGSVTLSATHLNEGDVDDSGAGLTYSVTTGPANGQLELTSSPGVAINSFTQDDIDNNRLIYVHNGSQTSTDNFDFTLADGLEDGAVAATRHL